MMRSTKKYRFLCLYQYVSVYFHLFFTFPTLCQAQQSVKNGDSRHSLHESLTYLPSLLKLVSMFGTIKKDKDKENLTGFDLQTQR